MNNPIFNFKGLFSYSELMKNLVYRDLKIKYKESILGILWSLLNPLLMLVIYTIAFQFIIRIDVDNFPLFFIIGLLPWNFLVASISVSVGSIVDNSHLIHKVYFPREVLVLSVVLSNLIQYLITLLILIPGLIYFNVPLSEKIILLPVIIILQTFFIIGICYFAALLYVFFRDMKHIVEVSLTVWFWLTPIVYPLDMVKHRADLMSFYMLNPMTIIISSYRNIIMYDTMPTANMFLRLILSSFIMFLAGRYFFLKYEKKFAELA